MLRLKCDMFCELNRRLLMDLKICGHKTGLKRFVSIVRIVWSWAELASLLASSVGCPYVVVNRSVGCVKSWFYLVSRLPQC